MQDLPHHYYASARASADSHVAVNACELPEIITAAPLEFGGPGDLWSPEHLLHRAETGCLVTQSLLAETELITEVIVAA
jgi:hypothetical protein